MADECTAQRDVLYEFVRLTNTGEGTKGPFVGFSMRGGPTNPRSYVNVFGPANDPSKPGTAVITIDFDGSIGLKDEELAARLGATKASVGTMTESQKTGRGAAGWELRRQANETIKDFVQRIYSALVSHHRWGASS